MLTASEPCHFLRRILTSSSTDSWNECKSTLLLHLPSTLTSAMSLSNTYTWHPDDDCYQCYQSERFRVYMTTAGTDKLRSNGHIFYHLYAFRVSSGALYLVIPQITQLLGFQSLSACNNSCPHDTLGSGTTSQYLMTPIGALGCNSFSNIEDDQKGGVTRYCEGPCSRRCLDLD